MTNIKTKLYRHYKNKRYKYLGEVRHSETLETLVLYKTRYQSDPGPLWVRPKEMFFESVVVDGSPRPRFEPVEFQLKLTNRLGPHDLDQITNLLTQVFGSFDRERIETRLREKAKVLLITAFENEKFVGFKLGYELNCDTFYSWLGAIDPEYQGLGLGKALLETQHEWCREQGYKEIETKTMNRWKAMLFLNLRCGFEITGTEENKEGLVKIRMTKRLDPSTVSDSEA